MTGSAARAPAMRTASIPTKRSPEVRSLKPPKARVTRAFRVVAASPTVTTHMITRGRWAIAMGKLARKVALITGSDSGMGQAMAEEFAREGADIAVSFHTDRKGADETSRRVKALGRKVLVRQLDVRVEESVL